MPQPDPHSVIAFAASLDTRPDRQCILAGLAQAFIAHRDRLWPQGDTQATPQWIAENAAAIMRTLDRFYRRACDPDEDHPGAAEFLQRMSWLPALIVDLEQGRARLDA